MSNLLIIEDDVMLNQGIAFNFQMDGFNITSAFTLEEAREKLDKENIDIIILDCNLPDGSGFDFCKNIRQKYTTPIVFLTACDTELDIITGLRIGADDYITKPFSINVLRERVLTVLRRCGKNSISSNIIKEGEFKIDLDKITVQKNGESIVLAPTEYKLLKKLILSKGEILTRQVLLEELWENEEYVEEHALTVNINRLRNKIEDNPSKPRYIKTVYGIGYAWTGEKY
ncbi:response regulator transcription factor [Clostridium sp. NSJ-49]|uniref:Stage 0 sporulation protein A homolog n=1 Tax=Clostridium hominis TaxID=2763036 RepID=A0ABR7DCQ8_9CLOT|nr:MULTISPECIES: response regulator transcription factor [Clostridium]MBC5625275.1 response regulator transcription factor [Clostridium sp. NSJ-49]MBC5629189.1 response regulator transcription factor [Clostridium hominis]MDY3361589.1 response regulator transcription factor [Clostridium celatum]SCI89755.1 Sensory transduction protein regX3 [uncultured Clostridium sp.]